jgi:hypothetical protein
MSVTPSDMALHAELDRFWQSVDQRTEIGTGVNEAHTDTPLFVWGIIGTPLALPQPHYRIFVPSPYYVTGWALIGNAAGNAVIKVEHGRFIPRQDPTTPKWRTYGTGAVVFTDATGGASPTLAAQQAVVTRYLPTWLVRFWEMFEVLHVYIDSTSGLEELSLQLFTRRMRRTGVQAALTTNAGAGIITGGGALVVG